MRKFDRHTSHNDLYFGAAEVYANGSSQLEVVMHNNTFILYDNWSTKKRRGMDLYTNGGNIRLGNYRRFTSLTMYNLHIFYLTPLMFPSMHDYCFLPCMWPQVIDLFSSKQAGIAGMAVSFSIVRGIAWPKGRSLA